MRSLFRKRQTSPDEIPDDLIAAIPDVEARAGSHEGAHGHDGRHREPAAAPSPDDWRPVSIPLGPAPPAAAAEPAVVFAPPAPAPAPNVPPARAASLRRPPEADVVALVAEVRRQMEAVFSRELAKVEDTFTATLRQMEGHLEKAHAEADGLRREKDDLLRVKAEYDRKAEALKELARSFDRT